MRRKSILLCIVCVMLFMIILIIQQFLLYRTCYLNLQFVDMTGNIEMVTKIKISSGKYEYDNITITEPEKIELIIHYLNTIPLIQISTSEFENSSLNDNQGRLVQFYNSDDLELGWISLSKKNILRSRDLKAFMVKDNDMDIISKLIEMGV